MPTIEQRAAGAFSSLERSTEMRCAIFAATILAKSSVGVHQAPNSVVSSAATRVAVVACTLEIAGDPSNNGTSPKVSAGQVLDQHGGDAPDALAYL